MVTYVYAVETLSLQIKNTIGHINYMQKFWSQQVSPLHFEPLKEENPYNSAKVVKDISVCSRKVPLYTYVYASAYCI